MTGIHIIVRDPALAEQAARVPHQGAGPCPIESILREGVAAHPKALLHPQRVADPAVRSHIEGLIAAAGSGAEHVVKALATGMARYARAFAPAPTVVRLSDLDTAGHASLPGGEGFEPVERNPMIGLRGASRYVHPEFAEIFELECEAVRRVREEEGLTNLEPLIPYCRSIAEAEAVLAAMAGNGLPRGGHGLRVHLMCELPSNVVLMDRFAPLFDGVSIGTLDLAQSVLGIDRDSAAGAGSFDECDPGVLLMMERAIAIAGQHGAHTSVCGQAPSEHREVVVRAAQAGVDAVGVRADAASRITGWLDDVG